MQKKRKTLNPILKIMRFTTFQLLLIAMTFSMASAKDSNAQEILNRRISINLENVELKKVISKIEKEANVNFTYSSRKIAVNQKVTLKATNETLKNVCEKLFIPIKINYKVYHESNIVLTYDPNLNKMGLMEKEDALPPVRGRVTDEDGEGIIGASIIEKGTTNGTTTDIDGNFSLNVADGATLVISYTGYNSQEVAVGADGVVNVVLTEGLVLGELTVIGSRGKARTDLDSPVPIDAIQASELMKTGQAEIAQSIHFTVPSFSAQKFGINDLAPLIDPAQLRGLGSDQTLLLVNGKRRHKVAFFNGNDGVGKGQLGNDINSIPSAAVERVEILRDGAAAQYGSDAIAGVVNMQLKNNREGGSMQAYMGSTYSSPEYDDVTNKGTPGEKIYGDDPLTDGNAFSTSLNFGLPWGDKDGYISTTLAFSHADATDRSGTYSHSSGWYRSEQYDSLGITDEQLQTQNGIDQDRAILGTAENTNGGIFINAGREINDTWDFYAMTGFTKKQIIGGVFTRTPARTSRAVIDIFYDGYNPEVPSVLTDWQMLSGMKAELGDGWKVDFSLGYSGNDVQLYARNTVNPSMGAASPTQFYTGGLRVTQSILNLDVVKSLTEGVSLAVGSEFRRETYEQSEGQKESWFPGELATSGRDIGSSGREGFTPQSTGFWDRNNLGIYAELEADITDEFLVTVAGRFEDYSDFGSDFSYKAAARYKITDDFALRGSVNRSFRAPALAQTHYSNFSQISFDSDGGSIVSPTLPVRDARVQSAFGIENLIPETSLDFAVGATAKLLDGALKLTLDAYQIAVKDRIFIASVAAADFGAFSTSGFDDINFFTNAINTTTQGLDFVATYKNRLSDDSSLGLSLAVNLNETVIDDLNVTSQLEPHISFDRTNNGSDFFIYLVEGTPRSKIIFSPTYTKGWFTVLARVSNFGEVSEPRLRYNSDIEEWDDNPPGGGEPQVLSAKTVVDLSLSAAISDNFSVTLGANNLFDVYPDMLREAQVRSEVIYSRRVNQFGTNGRFLNLTLNYNW